MFNYVWLNTSSGEFSNTWSEYEMEFVGGEKEVLAQGKKDVTNPSEWKLIKYKCVNDEQYRFNNMMKIK